MHACELYYQKDLVFFLEGANMLWTKYLHAHVSLDMPTAIQSQQLNLDKSDIDPAYDPNC